MLDYVIESEVKYVQEKIKFENYIDEELDSDSDNDNDDDE